MPEVSVEGRTVIVTGANTGIGKETAAALAKRGARVILACRSQARGDAAAADIKAQTGNDVHVRILDLASLESVRNFAKNIRETESRLDILINNAAVVPWKETSSEDGYEMQFAVNHLGHFLLTHELLDLLKSSAPSRIVNVSSDAHKFGEMCFENIHLKGDYKPFKAYSQSKLANVLFTRELHRRLEGTGVTTYALHPGTVKTEIGRNFQMNCCFTCLLACLTPCLKTPEKGSRTSVHCAIAEGIEEHSGRYFSGCAVSRTSAKANDDEAAKKLWTLSEQLVGLSQT